MDPISSILRLGLDSSRIEGCDVLCLPENIEEQLDKDQLFEASETTNLSKLLKEQGVTSGTAFDLGLEVPTLDRRSGALWLGLVWVLNEFALPVVISVLTNVIATRFANRQKDGSLKWEKGDVDLRLKIRNDGPGAQINYRGDPQTLVKMLTALDDSADGVEDES